MSKKYTANSIGLITARKAKGRSQKDLARLLNMSQPAYSQVERGATRLDEESVQAIASYLEVELEQIFFAYEENFTLKGLDHIELSMVDIDVVQELQEMIEGSYTLQKETMTDKIKQNLFKLLTLHPKLLGRIESTRKKLAGYEQEVFDSGQVRVTNFASCQCSGSHHKDFEYQQSLEKKYKNMILGYIYSSLLIARMSIHAEKDELYMLLNLTRYSMHEQKKIKKLIFALLERSIFYVNPIRLERLVSTIEDFSE